MRAATSVMVAEEEEEDAVVVLEARLKRPESFFSKAGQRMLASSIRKSRERRLMMLKAGSIFSGHSFGRRATQRSQTSELGGAGMV